MKLLAHSKERLPVSVGVTSGNGSESGPGNSHFLHAGQVHISQTRQPLVIILGSCVAVCLWDPISGIGGATHYLLPSWDGRGTASPRYGDVAIGVLLQKLTEAGAQRKQLRAKVFGGGCLFDFMRGHDTHKDHLGKRNVQMALDTLTKERIPVVSVEAGVDKGQRIVFQTHTGESSVKTL